MHKQYLLAIGLIVLLAIAVVVYSERTPTSQNVGETGNQEEEAVFCTMDAMECPDGSFVGRVAPSCEFAPCPSPADISGQVELETEVETVQ